MGEPASLNVALDPQLRPPTDPNLYAIEASRGHPPDERVYAIALIHVSSGDEKLYAAETVGGYNVDAAEIRDDPDLQESAVLTAFSKWAQEHPDAHYIHWHQSRDDYGIEHWRKRAIQRQIYPWPELRTTDLENYLRVRYGDDHYGGDPKREKRLRALENNGIDLAGIFVGKEAKAARDRRDWPAINKSLQCKVVALSKLYLKVFRGEYQFPPGKPSTASGDLTPGATNQPPALGAAGEPVLSGDRPMIVAGRVPLRAPTASELGAMYGPSQLAERFQLNLVTLSKRLERWRAKNGDGWREVTDRKPREPKYLYLLSAVIPLIEDMLAASSEGGPSSEMSA